MTKPINITDKELVRDIINLHLEEIEIEVFDSIDDIPFYSEEFKSRLKNSE